MSCWMRDYNCSLGGHYAFIRFSCVDNYEVDFIMLHHWGGGGGVAILFLLLYIRETQEINLLSVEPYNEKL